MRHTISAAARDHGDAVLAALVGFSATAMAMIALALLFV